jgi:hypothetical protein
MLPGLLAEKMEFFIMPKLCLQSRLDQFFLSVKVNWVEA